MGKAEILWTRSAGSLRYDLMRTRFGTLVLFTMDDEGEVIDQRDWPFVEVKAEELVF